MLRKMISLLVLTLFLSSTMGSAFANASSDMAVLDQVISVEKFFEGAEQTGSLVDRVSKLERDLFGKEYAGALVGRVDKLYSYCRVNSDTAPSYLFKINAAEWSLTHMVTVQPIKERLENLERVLLGKISTESFDERLNELLKFAYANGNLVANNVTVNKDSLVKIKLITPLHTRTSRSGDAVIFQVLEDVSIDESLVIAKGSQGMGTVGKIKESKNFGRDAQIQISFDTVEAIDGSTVQTILGEKAKEQNKSLATAAGASVAGMMLLGPIGIVGGAFIHGKDVEIPAGTEIYIQIKDQINLYGI